MGRFRNSILIALALGFVQAQAIAHAPINLKIPAFHHALLFPTSAHLSTNAFRNIPVSGSSRAFFLNVKTITGYAYLNSYQKTFQGTVTNTVLNTPLNNLSGQITGLDYFSFNSGVPGPYQPDQANVIYFGSNPGNTGNMLGGPPVNLTNFGNSFSGFPAASQIFPHISVRIFPTTFNGHTFSGPARILQRCGEQWFQCRSEEWLHRWL
jgi:hypothetical protein